MTANARMRGEHRPGSAADIGVPGLFNRAFIVKVNRFL